uniref:Polycystin-1-like protein 1 n=1 Tax=Scleropages formosus TaxID=113540 RepID=A0A8C9W6B2_SCLFO
MQPFYVQKIPSDLQLICNCSLVYKNEVVVFNAQLASGTNVTYTWNMGDQTTYITEGRSVVVDSNPCVYSCFHQRICCVFILYAPAVRIHTEKQAYTTGAIITFLAVSEEPDPLEFLWHFGEGPPQRTTSRSIKKRYHFPGRYNVVVSASNGRNSFTSNIHPIVIQRKVQPNRLLFSASVLLNTTVTFDCRINSGTNVTYTWSFGDGTWKTGRNTEHHVYERVGEFTVEVTVSNLVSSASLRRQIFVVSQPCQPPPVKNMGPVRIQLRRYQTMQLGVTYEGDIHCNISQDLLYTWALYESTGAPVQLPVIETHQQSIRLPSHFLHYGIYIATARIQIKDTVVYNNYTVHVEVVPSPPVSLIFGGTNIFISTHNDTVLILNGQGSYDPDYPENILSYQWACKPISNIHSTCFDGDFPASSPLLVFPSGILKPNFDQFRFTLTVRSGDRSSSSEVFVTITADLKRKVHVYCNHCQGTLVNWNEQFSVTALCENCEMSPGNIFYTWTFHLVNASSKVITESKSSTLDEWLWGSFGVIITDAMFCFLQFHFAVMYLAMEQPHLIVYTCWIMSDIEQDSRSKDFLGSRDTEGNNLMDSSNPYLAAPERTLLDLERHQISPAEFHTYTTTGIKPCLVPHAVFLAVSQTCIPRFLLGTQETMLGKTQFFFSTSDVPQGMACQVQPSRGYEIHTDFSIFCTSGQADLHYEYSYSTGSTPRRVLYRGRDFQHYFNLPSGEPQNSYKVTIYTQVRNQFGAATRPCPVTVEVLPSYRKNLSSAYSPEKKLYLDGLESLAKLTQKGNGMEVRNHIFLLTNVLNRLSQEPSAFQELQTTTRSVLISVVCEQAMPDQVLVYHWLVYRILYNEFGIFLQIHGHVADLTLYNCSTKTEIKVRHLSAPVTIEFPQKHQNRSGASQFCLQRSHMNVHQFNVTPENLQEVLLITVRFIRPTNRTFPIMILLRNFERPTPALYNSMKIHHWERDTVFIFLPLSSLNGLCLIYFISRSIIKYSNGLRVTFTYLHCLFWDGAGEWKADGCIPMQGQSSGVSQNMCECFSLSCNHLTTFTVAYREIQSHLEFICVSRFVRWVSVWQSPECTVSHSLWTERQTEIRRRGSVQIPDNSPSDRQLYAVTVDTGFRSRDTMTAKVYIVLHGEDRVSQTRELHVSDQLLFTRNSRHTFIISTPESLGPIWKVHLWHDNRGRSPSWYVSHVAIRDLVTGAERFFPGECWLAVDEGDGRVEKELIALTGPLEFRKVLYSKLTEYLEDLHSWASVYSRPSYSRFTHAQRLGVCLLLLQGYMCANATLLSLQDHELGVDLGPLHMSAVSLVMGILSTLVVLPVGALLSLLFRLSKVSVSGGHTGSRKWNIWEAGARTGYGTFFEGFLIQFFTFFLPAHGCLSRDQDYGSGDITLPPWCRSVAWTLCLTLSLVCAIVSAVLGTKWAASFFSACCEGIKEPSSILVKKKNSVSRIQRLQDGEWFGQNTRAVAIQFTLFNPPTGLFTAVSLLVEQPIVGGLLPSTIIQSTRVYRTTGTLDRAVIAFEVSALKSLLQPLGHESISHKNFYLEEFEALVDELLFRLDAVTDSPHHTLPSEALGYEESERSLTPRSDRTGSLLFEVGKPGFLQVSTSQRGHLISSCRVVVRATVFRPKGCRFGPCFWL